MRLLVLPGDGIGPEITRAALSVLEAACMAHGVALTLDVAEVGLPSLAQHGSTITDAVIEKAVESDGVILGPVSHLDYPPVADGGLNPSGVLRKRLDLFANIRPACRYPGVEAPIRAPLDMVTFRENTEGFYADRTMFAGSGEFMPTEDVALAVRKVTRKGCQRIAEQAFAWAASEGRKVTAVHKVNVLRISDRLFLDEVRAVAAGYPDLEYDEVLVDAAAALLVRDPGRFGVLVTTNMFGDILSDLAAELAGGLGLAGSLNAGESHAMAQAAHGSAPDIAGHDRANPSALILSVAMLLIWLGQRSGDPRPGEAAAAIRRAVVDALASAGSRTRDLGGTLGTEAFADRIVSSLTE